MTDETPQINNEAAFLAAIGLNPNNVRAGSITIEFQNGVPIICVGLMLPTTWDRLGIAIAAGTTGTIPEATPKQPDDHKPPQKRPAKKKP